MPKFTEARWWVEDHRKVVLAGLIAVALAVVALLFVLHRPGSSVAEPAPTSSGRTTNMAAPTGRPAVPTDAAKALAAGDTSAACTRAVAALREMKPAANWQTLLTLAETYRSACKTTDRQGLATSAVFTVLRARAPQPRPGTAGPPAADCGRRAAALMTQLRDRDKLRLPALGKTLDETFAKCPTLAPISGPVLDAAAQVAAQH